jgi:tetratricopeptide (TPR) repeat protein
VSAAEPVFHRALDVARRGKVRRHEARALLALASICEQARRPAESRQYIEAALPFYREAGYRREVIQATIIMGGVYSQQAEYESSIRMLRGVLPDAVQLRDATVEAQTRERLAEALRDQGDWPSALDETERATSLFGLTGQSLDVRLNGTRLRWKLGRRADAAQSLAEVERLLERHPNPLNSFDLMVLKSEMAYEDGRISQTATLARQALALQGASADARSRASLLLSVALIRGRREAEALAMASSTLDELDHAHRALEAAQAHLSLAEALVEAGQGGPARGHALKALAFFEPRRIVEATWRAHLVAARAAGPEESGQHRQAAMSALASLKSSWPAPDVGRYLERPDIRLALRRL